MNKINNKSLGKRSTNTASLSNAISSIKSSISPVLQTGKAPSNPKPLKVGGEMWLPRSVRVFLTQATSVASVALSTASVFNNAKVTGEIRVLRLKVWNYTNQGSTTNYVGVLTDTSITETDVTTNVDDVGNSMSLPGVSVVIPRTIAANLVSGTASVCTIRSSPASGNPTAAQTFCVDVHFEYKTNTSD